MKRIRKTVTSYRCGQCGTDYDKKSEAAECETGTCEPRRFRVGDEVRAIQSRFCSRRQRSYKVTGKIVRISRPEPYDAEVLLKGFGVERVHDHFRWYEVEYVCPPCGHIERAEYPADALKCC